MYLQNFCDRHQTFNVVSGPQTLMMMVIGDDDDDDDVAELNEADWGGLLPSMSDV